MTPLNSLVPMIFVKSVLRSVEFYKKLGFEMGNTFTPSDQTEPTWAWLKSGGAHLMVTTASHPVDPSAQAVMFTIYCEDVLAARADLQMKGLEVSEVEYPFYSPRGQFSLADPDGFALTITHT